MKAEIRIVEGSNGYFHIYLDEKEFATVYYENNWDKAVEVVKQLDPESPLHNPFELAILWLLYRTNTARTNAKDWQLRAEALRKELDDKKAADTVLGKE